MPKFKNLKDREDVPAKLTYYPGEPVCP